VYYDIRGNSLNRKILRGIIAIIIFFVILFSPFIYNAISSNSMNYGDNLKLKIEKSLDETRNRLKEIGKKPECIKERKIMRNEHGTFLMHTRDEIVRDIKKADRKVGLSSCINCHRSKKSFCNECHNYMSVQSVNTKTGCFACHFYPNNDDEWIGWNKQMTARER